MKRRKLLALLALGVAALTAACAPRRGRHPQVKNLRLNHEFAPMGANLILNDRYSCKVLCTVGKTRVYFLRETDRKKRAHDIVCLYAGELKDHPAFRGNAKIHMVKSGLPMFLFNLWGNPEGFSGYECSLRQTGITIVKRRGRVVLFLDQLFSGGGSGGHRKLIARKYMVVENGKARVTSDYSIITHLRVGYPRNYGMNEWVPGSMSYSHRFGHRVFLKGNRLTVNCRQQRFDLKEIFKSANEVTPKPKQGVWGEDFKYNDFIVPGAAQVRETKQRKEFQLRSL